MGRYSLTSVFIVAACLLAGLRAQAQEAHQGESFTLDAPLSPGQSHIYVAGDRIGLLPGFRSEPQRYRRTELRIDPYYGVFPPEEGLTGGPHVQDQGVVGALGGTVDVGAMGAAVYTIPLDLPTGINGMRPSLAVTYNSQAGNGLMGWGWDLAGLSAIERTGRTRYHDGVTGAVTLDDATDRFTLDGARLIAVADHGDSLEFKTELDGMSRIMAYTAGTVGSGDGTPGRSKVIASFRVSLPDGRFMEYGGTSDSRIEPRQGGDAALCWLLDRVSDRNGNSVVYHYTEHADTGEWYISSIDYTEHAENGSVTVSPEFTVGFSYRSANNPDCEFRYVAGSLVRNRRLIDHISVVRNGGGAELQRYTFVYRDAIPERFYDSVRMHTRLESIFYEVDGMELNPTRIEWTKDHDDNVMVNLYMTEQDTAIYHNFPFVGDFNGDGYSDLAVAPLKDSAYLSSPALRIFMNNPGNPGHFTEDPARAVTGLERALDWVYVADLNDDGLDDLVTYCLDSTALSGADTVRIAVFQNTGTDGFGHRVTTGFRGGRPAVHAGDFLGTGKAQLLLFPLKQAENGQNTRPKLLRYEGGTPIVSTTMALYLNVEDVAVGDFDGDGRTEVALVRENGTTVCKVELSNGICSFVPLFTCPGINHADNVWNHVFEGDFNGDGMTDLLYGDSLQGNLQRWRIFHSTGLSFSATGPLYDLSDRTLPNTRLYPNSLKQVTYDIRHPLTGNQKCHGISVADFDGDGADDIAGSTLTSYSCNIEVRFLYNPDTHDFQSSFLSSFYNGSHHNNQGYYYVNCRTQYFHVGNFLGKDNLSFLGLEDRNDDWQVSLRKPGVFSLKPSSSLNSVKSVTDGMGNTTEFEYGYILQPYQNYGYGVRTPSVPVRVLSKVTSYNASGRPMESEFRYRDPCYHRDGHGWIGFGRTERRSYADGDETSVEVSCQSLDAMGIHAMLLPDADTAYVFPRGTKTLFSATSYEFEKVLSSYGTLNTDHLVVCPALTGKTVTRFNPDTPGTILSKTFTESDYSYDNGLYLHTYHCDSTLTGVGHASTTCVAGCEFRTSESTTYYQDTYGTWTVNRPQGTLVVQSRTGKPDVARLHQYEYVSPSSLLVSRTYDIPSRTAGQHPLTVQVDYEYFPDGNLKKKTVRAPYGQYGEQQKTLSYVYGPSHRLVASETIGSGDLSYTTAFSYDAYDQVDTLTPPNGLALLHDGDPLGISALAVEADGARSHTVKRWATGHPLAPSGASFYTWAGSSDGTRTLAFFHKTGAELRTVAYDLLGEPVFTDRQYDGMGRLSAVSEPYKTGDTVRWTSYGHDGLDRMTSITLPDRTETSVAYDGFTTETSVATPGGLTHTSASSVNAMGWTDRCMDPGGAMINYDHYADGLVSSVTVNGDAATTVTVAFDDARNKSSVSDPDYGLLSTVHDAYGRLVQSTSPRELTAQTATEYTYDGLDRTTRVFEGLEGTMIGYTYNENGKTKGTLSGMRFADHNNMDIQCFAYTYDSLARLVASSEQRPEGSYSTLIEYDSISRPIRVVHPSGYAVRYRYARGQIRTVTDDAGAMLWRTDSVNACGQPLSVRQGRNLTTRYTYDPTRRTMTETKTRKGESFLQHFSYTYDNFGNLATRKDVSHNMEETFTYDDMDRLTEVGLNGVHSQVMTYDGYGRMTSKTAGGQAVFSGAVYDQTSKPHALDKAVTASGLFPSTPQTVSYTGFDKVGKVRMGSDSLVYTYGYGHQRIAMEEHVGNTVRTKRYVGACERVTETMGSLTTDCWLTYLSGPFGVFAVVERRQGVNTLHYILKNHLGSWTTITASDGTLEQRLSYDAWGNLRNPNTWSGSFTGTPMFDRGFTGHEHLAAFGLINMNGRMYDPMMSSFLSVDRFVQSFDNSQSFNRYAYCLYNPLRYMDPTGWVMSRPEGSGILPPPDGDEFDDYVPGMVTSGGYSSEYDAYTYSYNLHEVTVSASRYTWAEEQCRNITWYGREEYSPEYSGGEVYISYGGIGGGGGGGACSNGSWNTKEIVNGGIQLSGYVLSVTSSLQSCQGYTLKTSEDYTRIGKNLNKAQKAKLALKYPEQLSKSASAAKYGRAVAKGMRQSGNILGAVGVGLELAEVGLSGEVYASNFYNVTIGIACIVAGPYGWIIGGVALVGDIAFYAFTGRNIGGNIDRLFDDKGLRIFGGVY